MSAADDALIAEATDALAHAHAPYSKFPVGAAVHTTSGKVFKGANVENASYGLSMCAERTAVFAAATAGERKLDTIAIVTNAPEPTPPCGACRQVMLEFADDDAVVLLATTKDLAKVERTTLGALVPRPFRKFEPGA